MRLKHSLLLVLALSIVGTVRAGEVGSYPDAATLLGSERMLSDQNGITVDITPVQIGTYLFPSGYIPASLFPPLTGDCTTTTGSYTIICLRTNGSLFAPSATIDTTNASNILSGTLAVARGGLGVGSTPAAGQVPIGNGTGYTVGNLTAGSNITISNTAGGIQISAVGGTGNVVATGSPVVGALTLWTGSTAISSGNISGDCTTTNTLAITCTKTSGTLFGPSATIATDTGSGSVVLATSPSLVTPNLGTPSAINLANATNLPASALPLPTATTLGGVESFAPVTNEFLTSIGTNGVPTAAQPSAANLSNGTTGSGAAVLATSPALVTPNLGTPSAATLTNATGLPTTGLTGTLQAAQEPAHTGDATNTAGSLALSVVKVNGGAVPASASVLGSNSASQLVSTATTGTGSAVLATSPTLATPNLGTPSAVTLTNATGLPLSGIVSITADTLVGNPTGSSAAPVAITLGTNLSFSGTTLNATGGSGSGTVNNGTSGQMAYYASTGTAVSGDADATINNGALTLGIANTTLGNLILEGNTSGAVTIQPQATAGTYNFNLPITAGSSGNILASGGGTTTPMSWDTTTGTGSVVVLATSPSLTTPNLGVASATSLNGNTFTTGTYTLTGSAGKTLDFTNSLTLSGTDSTTMTFPGTSGTVDVLNNAQTFTAAKTFTNSDLLLLGSSTGANTFTAANASSTNYTTTVPANTGTLAETNLAQTFSAVQTFNNSDIDLLGSSTGYTTFANANSSATNYTLTFPAITDTVTTNTATQTLTGKSIAASEVNSGTLACAQEPARTGDATSSAGSCAMSVVQVNGASVPASAAVLSSNSSSQLASASTTGSGNVVLATSPTLVTPALGTPSSVTLTNATGLPLTGLASQANNTFVGNVSGSSASPSALSASQAIGLLNSCTANAQSSTTYTYVLGDANCEVTGSNTASQAYTVPPNSSVAYAVGTLLTTQSINTGVLSVGPGSGVTFLSPQYGSSTSQTYSTGGEYGFEQWQKTATNTFNLLFWMTPAGVPDFGGGGALSGTCTTSASTLKAKGGRLTMSSAGNCTIIFTPSGEAVPPDGYACTMHDRTQPTLPAWGEVSDTTTTVTFDVPTAVASSDVLSFNCQAD